MRISTRGAILGLTCAFGWGAPALAQDAGDDPPAPAPPAADGPGSVAAPAAEPPPAPPSPGTAPLAVRPPTPAPRVPFEAAPVPPAGAEPEVEPTAAAPAKPSSLLDRFAGSYVDWGHVANSELLGVGASVIGREDYSYEMAWNIAPSFFALRSERHDVRLRANLGVSMEVTNSNTTTQKNEAQLEDLPLTVSDTIALASWGGPNVAPSGPAAAFNPTLDGGSEYGLWLSGDGGVILPTSKAASAYRYLATGLGVAVRQRIKLLGGAAPGLRSLTLSLAETWRHDFNRTQVPTTTHGSIARQNESGNAIVSDVVSPWLLTTDRLATTLSAILPLYGNLELSAVFAYRMDFKPAPPQDQCVKVLTGCAAPAASPQAATSFSYTRLDVALAYRFLPELVVDIGYDTLASTANTTGRTGTVFYHPGDSVFYADVAFFPEQLFQRFARSRAAAQDLR